MRNVRILTIFLAAMSACPLAATAKEAEETSATKSTKPKLIKLAAINIGGEFPETETQVGLFGELEQSLAKTIARIDQASEDDDISGIILALRTPSVGRGKINELRAAIARLVKRVPRSMPICRWQCPAIILSPAPATRSSCRRAVRSSCRESEPK